LVILQSRDLTAEPDGTFQANPFSFPPDIRFVTPVLQFTNKPFRLWLQRIDAYDDNTRGLLDWIEKVNATLYVKFDQFFDE
jgi:hypothetical protein